MEPTTMPAIAPPESPPPPPPLAAAAVELELGLVDVADGPPVVVPVGRDVGFVVNSVGMAENTGSLTFLQRLVEFEVTQHESVSFSVLSRQKLQSPIILDPKPQLVGSFSAPLIQFPLSEFAGSAQLVKSARSCGT